VSEHPAIAPAEPLTVLEATSQVVAEQRRELKRQGKAVRQNEDPEAVHQMRVATRRLRTALRALHGHVRAPKRLGKQLAWLAGKLGRVRDDDVIVALLGGRTLTGPASDERTRLARLVRRLTARRDKHRAALVEATGRGKYRRLLDDLAGFAAEPLAAQAEQAMASRALAEVSERLGEAVAKNAGMTEPAPTDVALHELRIAFKRLRYALDFHAEACGLAYDVERRLARQMQDVLGEIHDRDLLLEWLKDGKGAFRGPWPRLDSRLVAERARLFRRFLRLRREWTERTREEPAVAPLEEPRFVHLEPQPVTLRLVRGSKHVASTLVI
jgi:CHAD domain-containing protein